jgi:hypothetical protein
MRRHEDGWLRATGQNSLKSCKTWAFLEFCPVVLIQVRGAPGGRLLQVVAPRVPLAGANTQVLCSLLAPFLSAGGPCRLTVVLGNVAHVPRR